MSLNSELYLGYGSGHDNDELKTSSIYTNSNENFLCFSFSIIEAISIKSEAESGIKGKQQETRMHL